MTHPRIAGNYRATGSLLNDNPGSVPSDNQQLVQIAEEREGKQVHYVFKTKLWRSAMKLDTDHNPFAPASSQYYL